MLAPKFSPRRSVPTRPWPMGFFMPAARINSYVWTCENRKRTRDEAPSSKSQAPSSKQPPKRPGWGLGFGVSLELGAWDLELVPETAMPTVVERQTQPAGGGTSQP